MLELLGTALVNVAQVKYLVPLFFGTLAGVVGGALPGVTITMTIIVVLPFTFGLDPLQGLAAMTGVYVGGSAGGLVTGFGTLQLAHRELVACAQIAFLNPVTSSLTLSSDWLVMGHDFAPTDQYRASGTRYDSDSNTTRTVIRASRGDRVVLRLTRNGVDYDYYDEALANGDETIEVPVTPRPRRGDVIKVIVNGEVVQHLLQ